MSFETPASLAVYAYQQAGGGSQGLLAALAAVKTSTQSAVGLLEGTGTEVGGTNLDAATFPLQVEAGQGEQALEALLNPPLGYANPFAGPQNLLTPDVAASYAAYRYLQAQAAGQGTAYTQAALGLAQSAAQAGSTGLFALQSPATAAIQSLAAASSDPADANGDGIVSTVEELNYALQHPQLDPRDTNFDGVVSFSEELAYDLRHPASFGVVAAGGTFDLYA